MTTPRTAPILPPEPASPGDVTLGFGKYADWPLRLVPAQYLVWLVGQVWFRRNFAQDYYPAAAARVIEHLKAEAATAEKPNP